MPFSFFANSEESTSFVRVFDEDRGSLRNFLEPEKRY